MAYKLLVLLLTALLTSPSNSAEADLSWTEPTQNDDGSPLTDLASYEIHYGCSQSGAYGTVEYLDAPATSYTVLGLPDVGSCYFAAKAVNSVGISSVYSNEATRYFGSLEVPGTVTDTAITWRESVSVGFAYTGGTTNAGSGTTPSTGTHGITINSGDLVVVYVNSNTTGGVVPVAGGEAFTEAFDELFTDKSASLALYWKVAGGSEPGAYTFTHTNAEWRVVIKVFTSATDAVVDAVASTAISVGNTVTLVCDAPSGVTVAANAVSIVVGAKDNRANDEAYTVADQSYVSTVGNKATQAAAMAHRIWTTGGTDATVTLETADGNDFNSETTFSGHISFVESGGGASTTINLPLLGTG